MIGKCTLCRKNKRTGSDLLCDDCLRIDRSGRVMADAVAAYRKDGVDRSTVDCPYCDARGSATVRIMGMHRGNPIVRALCSECKWAAMT